MENQNCRTQGAGNIILNKDGSISKTTKLKKKKGDTVLVPVLEGHNDNIGNLNKYLI
jgi:hypothetical protein